jgi:hypothetical protein
MEGRTMMNKAGVVTLVIGLGLLLASLFADLIGIGQDPGFGTQQIQGTAAGLLITAAGFLLVRKEKPTQE